MPIYEYVCQKCGKKTEVIRGYSDPQPRICPHCGGKLKKAFSAPAIQFKGSGWYVNDYGKGDAGPRKKESESGGKSESSEKAEKADKSEKSEKSESKSDSGGEAGKGGAEKKSETKKKGGGKKGD